MAKDTRLEQFLGKDKLSKLTASEQITLSEYFSTNELRQLATMDVAAIQERLQRIRTQEEVRKLREVQREELPELMTFYEEVSEEISEIYCSKCGVLLALELKHKQFDANHFFRNYVHPEGKFTVAVGPELLAYRARTDEVMGYECGNILDNPEYAPAISTWEKDRSKRLTKLKKDKSVPSEDYDIILDREFPKPNVPEKIRCLNDTRWSEPELKIIPKEHILTSLTREDVVKTKQYMSDMDYKPNVRNTTKGKKIESFEARRIK